MRTLAARALGLPRRYPVTLVWAVLMVVMKSGVLEQAPPAAAAIVAAVAAPIMIPAYIVGFAWLGLGGAVLGIGLPAPLWFEGLGVVIVAGAYALVDRALWGLRSPAADEGRPMKR